MGMGAMKQVHVKTNRKWTLDEMYEILKNEGTNLRVSRILREAESPVDCLFAALENMTSALLQWARALPAANMSARANRQRTSPELFDKRMDRYS